MLTAARLRYQRFSYTHSGDVECDESESEYAICKRSVWFSLSHLCIVFHLIWKAGCACSRMYVNTSYVVCRVSCVQFSIAMAFSVLYVACVLLRLLLLLLPLLLQLLTSCILSVWLTMVLRIIVCIGDRTVTVTANAKAIGKAKRERSKSSRGDEQAEAWKRQSGNDSL